MCFGRPSPKTADVGVQTELIDDERNGRIVRYVKFVDCAIPYLLVKFVHQRRTSAMHDRTLGTRRYHHRNFHFF